MSADIDTLEAQVRCLENENRQLRETLRDRFAMAALPEVLRQYDSNPHFDVSKRCYLVADNMLKART